VRLAPDPDKDLSLLHMLLPPENVIPDYVSKARVPLADFEGWQRTHPKATIEELREARNKILGPVARDLKRQARSLHELRGTDLAQPRRAAYLTAFADDLMGALTLGERVMAKAGFAPSLARTLRSTTVAQVYNTTTGFALDTALQNLTQPLLVLAHVPAKYLARATKLALTKEGRSRTEHLKTGRPTDLEEVLNEVPRHARSRVGQWFQTYTDWAQLPLAKTDLHNRRVSYLAAHDYAIDNGASTATAHQWAMAVTRKTQGDPSSLGRSPILRGPFIGMMTPFTKYPTMFTAHMADVWQQPDVAGKQRMFGTLAALVGLGALMGVDLNDLLISGGRPLGLDPMHPGQSTKRLLQGDAFPMVRAAKQVGALTRGEVDLSDLAAGATVPRYAKQTYQGAKQLATYPGPAYPQYDPKTGVLLGDRTAGEIGLNAVGVRTRRQTNRRQTLRDFFDRARSLEQEHRQTRTDAYAAIGEALDTGDPDAAAEAMRQVPDASALKQFLRRRNVPPEVRRKQQLPRALRSTLDREFSERFKQSEIP
jgi:hypothetical protein